MMKTFHKQLLLVLFLGGVGIFLFMSYQNYTKEYFENRENINQRLDRMLQNEIELNYQVLKTSFFLYQNYDILSQLQKRLQNEILALSSFTIFKNHPDAHEIFARYSELLKDKLQKVEELKTYNAIIKNSTTYLITLLHKMPKKIRRDDKKADIILGLIGDILIAKNSHDSDFLEDIQKSISKLRNLNDKDPYIDRVLMHSTLFVKNFWPYIDTLNSILNLQTVDTLQKLQSVVTIYYKNHFKQVENIFYLLLLFYLISLLLITYFLYRLSQENEALKRLQKRLETFATTDDLTGLYNRRAYKKDIRKVKSPFFVLVDINRFKQYNDFYGNKMGDHILRQSAKIIKKAIPLHYQAKLYRIGGDEFGILIDESIPINEETFAKNIIDSFNKEKIIFKNIEIAVSVAVGITRKRPLLESADMALRSIKDSHHKNYAVFEKNLNYFQKIKENIKKSKELKEAVEHNDIVPFFQPIIDTSTAIITKYESLARIRVDDEYKSIYPYIDLAKEMGLYPSITKAMIHKSFEAIEKLKKPISINISMNDIENPEILKILGKYLKQHQQISHLITFEILESETLKDYKSVKDFISILHAQGCKVAIDDFGSGYSNFSHIFNLDMDYVKIDGSLIRKLPSSQNAREIVQAIHNLAKSKGAKTIAEHVSDGEIFDEVVKIGIPYAQGFFFGKPSRIV